MAPRLRFAIFLVATCLARWATPVAADDSKAQAASEFASCQKLSNVSDFTGAIAACKQAYLLDAQPNYLYALAQVYRFAGQHADAVHSYAAYLADYGSTLTEVQRGHVQELLDGENKALESQAAPPRALTPLPATEPASAPAHTAPPGLGPASSGILPTASASHPWYRDWVGWTLVASGAVATGIGAGLWLNGASLGDQAAATPNQLQRDQLYSSSSHYETGGLVSGAIGVALIAGGVVKFILDPSQTADASVGAAVIPGGAVFTCTGVFQ
jgi:hypothetical protein